ncbi:MAG TPA: CheR family methyltransferase [Thermoleophilaceae bacterium]|nr:CheR family methyltransferase [Thermoleophilaceae bacterium]
MARETADSRTRDLQDLLDYLKRSRGFDFSAYKRTTVSRRIEKRMAVVNSPSFADYQDYLEVNPQEFTELFNTILINVTSFFRDQAAWEFLSHDVVPRLLESSPTDQAVRVWSAGCASGEEPYTVAMVLAEAMGDNAFKSRVKIYATDLDDDALAAARQGVYSNDAVKPVPPELLDKYFEPNARGIAFRPDLRRAIIFGRNDLIADAPISRIDLLLCRNVLMYFSPEAQGHILERFNFALNPAGFLFLGKSEMLIAHGELFSPHNLKWRVFRKVRRSDLPERLAFVVREAEERVDHSGGVRAAAAALAPVAQIVIDRRGFLVDANRRARDLLGVAESDVGRPFQDSSLSYRMADLRSAVDRAYEQRLPIRLEGVRSSDHGQRERVLDIEVAPVVASNGEALGASISFNDVTAFALLSDEYERSKHELENAYEELQSTVEELETTNEELQSTNEELETTNEELQSTNEELETMNEELQSTNDELETMNTEVNARAIELDRLNLFFEGILGSLRVGVIVIDRAHRIQVWNAMSKDLWGLRADEVEGHDLMELDIGLPVKNLDDAIARAFGGAAATPIEERVEAINRRGRRFSCLVRVLPLSTRNSEVYAAMILATPESGL